MNLPVVIPLIVTLFINNGRSIPISSESGNLDQPLNGYLSSKFPGLNITQSLLYPSEVPIPVVEEGAEASSPLRSPPPHLKPDGASLQVSNVNLPYLFPYMFPGAVFPGISLPPVPGANGIPNLIPFEKSGLPSILSGVSQPFSEGEVDDFVGISSKGALLPPWKGDSIVNKVPITKPLIHVESGESPFEISSPKEGQIIISIKIDGEKDMTKDIMQHLETTLGKVKNNQQQIEEDGIVIKQDTVEQGTVEDAKEQDDHDEIKLDPIISQREKPKRIKGKNDKDKDKSKTTNSKPFGIQHKEEESKRPFLASLIMNPLGSLPQITWPSFASIFHRLTLEVKGSNKASDKKERMEDGGSLLNRQTMECPNHQGPQLCSSPEKGSSSCADFCTRNGPSIFSGGSCAKEGCICYLVSPTPRRRRKLGLIFKPHEGKVSVGENCEDSCRRVGFFTGICGGGESSSCYCAIPWHDGSSFPLL